MRSSKNDMLQLMRLVEGLKLRRIFVSMVMTTTKTEVSYWDSGAHKVVTTDQYGAQHYLNMLNANDRCELEHMSRRMGRVF